jgi:predicted ATPase/DNA-binding SARP family transcriptional activator
MALPHAAPTPLTRFVGRDRELRELARLVPTTRLLTLTGAGGSGKTRLAGEATVRAPANFERVLWTDLAPIHDEARIIPAIGITIGVQERADLHTIDTIVDAIGDRAMLLVLDNCEHLVDACAGIAETLLRQCPQLTILATSREALGVPGETAWLVPPMHESEAVQLFLERAQSVLPSFAITDANVDAVREICRRLDGIPLAIELAAARVRVLSPQQIADRLSDAFSVLGGGSRTALARQRTLRGAIDWSFALLTPHEQRLLLRLSVFAGSFSIDAVETICTGAPLDDASVLDELSGLVDKSLVVMAVAGDDARYRLLETVRQYAEEQRRKTDECEGLRDRHAAWYIARAERAEPKLFGGAADMSVITEITADVGNFRSAFDWCAAEPARVEPGLRGAYALHWYWFAQGQFEEGRQRLQLAQRFAADASIPARTRGLAMIALGHIHLWQGRPQDAQTCMQQALDLLQPTDENFAIAYAQNGLGAALYLSGDIAHAEPFFTEAARRAERFPDHVLRVIIHYWIGRMLLDAGRLDEADAALKFATVAGRRIRHRPGIAHPLLMTGVLASVRGNASEAHTAFLEALEILHEIGDVWGSVQGLEGAACALHIADASDTATVMLGGAEAMRERIATPRLPGERERIDAVVRDLERVLGRRFEDLWSTGRALSREAVVALALNTPWPPTPVALQGTADSGTAPGAASADAPVTNAPTAEPHSAAAAVQASVAPTLDTSVDLTLRMLGPLQVRVHGVDVESGAWGSARSRELLLFLVCHPHGATKEQVGTAFWPDASSAQVRNTFHVTLHRLRKALGHPDWIVLHDERYRLAPHLVIDCDALRFEREMSDALKLVKRKSEQAADAVAHALSHYSQDFLAGESVSDWHVTIHDRLQRLFFDGLHAQAALQLEQGHYAEAMESSRRLLQHDSLDEEAWRSIMTAHARAGERTQALRFYQQMVEVLQKELESEPDRTTTKLAQRIQNGETV